MAERRILSRQFLPATPVVSSKNRPDHRVVTASQRTLQADLLQRVSRTFALTIPRLDPPLADVVGNGYLLCRLVDTIEDELAADADPQSRAVFFARFDRLLEQVAGGDQSTVSEDEVASLVSDLSAALRDAAPAGERQLVERLAEVLAVTSRFDVIERGALLRCVRTMTDGMHAFESGSTPDAGLADVASLEHYCYHVAGVVGEMLTELFCHHSPRIAARRGELMKLAVPFGNGLQLTNILKDVWDDHQRGVCWLPREAFDGVDADLGGLFDAGAAGSPDAAATIDAGLGRLVGLDRSYLDDAVRYVLTLPASEHGVRVFCLWSVSMAVLTLRKIHARKTLSGGDGAKITRNSVRASLVLSDLCARNDRLLRAVHAVGSRGLPQATSLRPGSVSLPASSDPVGE